MTFEIQSTYRALYTHKDPWTVKVGVHFKGSGTMGELVEYLKTEHPEIIEFSDIHIAPAFLSYRLEPTQERPRQAPRLGGRDGRERVVNDGKRGSARPTPN